MSTLTFGPGDINKNGTEIVMADASGNATVVHCPADSTVTVSTLRSSPLPNITYQGTSADSAAAAVVTSLVGEGVAH